MKVKRLFRGFIAALLVFLSACSGGAEAAAVTLEIAQKYLSEGNYEEAIEAFTALIEIDPENTSLYMQRADAYVYVEKYQEAVDDYSFVIDREDSNHTAINNRGILHYVLGDLENGDADLKRIAELADGTEEEKNAAYEELTAYLERLGIPVVSSEDNDHYKAEIYELPGGGHLVIARIGDEIFTVQSFPEGEEVPDLSMDNAMLYFDWYSPTFLWADNNGNWTEGDIRVDFKEDGTVEFNAGGNITTYPYYYQDSGMYAGYYLIGGSGDPLDIATSHYALFGDFDDFWGLIIGETHEANEELFVPVMPD